MASQCQNTTQTLIFDGNHMQYIDSLEEIIPSYNIILCDIWGCIHNGVQAFDKAVGTLVRAREHFNIPVVLISNSPRPSPHVITQMHQLGISPECYDGVVTSGDLMLIFIQNNLSGAFFFIGPQQHLLALGELNVNKITSIKEADYIVCTAPFNTDDNIDDYMNIIETGISRDIPFICGNPDMHVYHGNNLHICAGSIAKIFSNHGGKVIYHGKPYSLIYEHAKQHILSIEHAFTSVLAIGDGIGTDITGANRMGFDSLLIARGLHHKKIMKCHHSYDAPQTDKICKDALIMLCDEYNEYPSYVIPSLI